MTYETLYLKVEDNIGTITLNRPDRLNAFNGPMAKDINNALDQLAEDPEVKVVIFTGEGRGFCAGADLSGGSQIFNSGGSGDPTEDEVKRDTGGRVTLKLFDFPKPVICAVNGPAVGIGVTMQLAMDIRIASDKARFGFVFNSRGINPEAASGWFLPRIVGISKALEWCYTGRVFDAKEALDGGLVSKVVPHDELINEARKLASEIIANTAPVSNALTRQMMWKMLGADHPIQAHQIDSYSLHHRGRSDDVKEGITSFMEKRPANFPDTVKDNMPDFYPWWTEREFGKPNS